MVKIFMLAIITLLVGSSWADSPVVTDVIAKQRYPWNGLVDITCKVSRIYDPTERFKFSVVAVLLGSGRTNMVSNLWIIKEGKKSANLVSANGNYRLLWDAKADLGQVHYTNMIVSVTVKNTKMQLWEGGPYWAATNIGAEEPWESGYYFWWGDTIGHKWENDKWIASDGVSSNLGFYADTCPTYNKTPSDLQSEGWITSGEVLTPEHDAAQVQWGGVWRMPTAQEFISLTNKCDWIWTTMNGVDGYIVQGRGDYTSNSIFLPCAGEYNKTQSKPSFYNLDGFYWSSVIPMNMAPIFAYKLSFYSPYNQINPVDHISVSTVSGLRYTGRSIRPVQGFINSNGDKPHIYSDSAPFLLDTMEEPLVNAPIVYDSEWIGGNDNATVVIMDNGTEVNRTIGDGEFDWTYATSGKHILTYTTYIDGIAQDEVYTVTVFKDWKYIVENGKATITDTMQTSGDVVIPSEIDGYPVVRLGNGLLSGCAGLNSITIPDSVTSIGDFSFYNCKSLTSIKIPDSVTSIGRYAFYDCNLLESLIFPVGLTNIGYKAFADVTALKNVLFFGGNPCRDNDVIFDSVASDCIVIVPPEYDSWSSAIESGTWQGMKVIPAKVEGGPYTEIVDGCEWVFCVSDAKASVGCRDSGLTAVDLSIEGDLIVPDLLGGRLVSGVGDEAFVGCSRLKTIRIPDSVTVIGKRAFAYCSSLEKVYVPFHLKGKISRSAFDGCADDFKVVYYSDDGEIEEFWWTKILLDANGGISEVSYILEVETFLFENLPQPRRVGYLFMGWFTEKDGGVQIWPDTVVTAEMAGMTLYAHWQETPKLPYQVVAKSKEELENEGYVVVASAEEFMQMAANNRYAKIALGGNIDFSGIEYEPIGTPSDPFKGVLNGNGYAIRNLTISKKDSDYVGLFGAIQGLYSDEEARIENLWLENVNVCGNNNVGVLVGRAYGAEFINVSVIGAVVKGTDCVGGLVGQLDSSEVSDGQLVSIDVEGNNDVGGAFGYCLKSNVRSVEVKGDRVQGVANVGGFTGKNDYATIEDCGANAKISGNENVGGFSGRSVATTIERCHASGKIEKGMVNVGGFCGQFVGNSASSVISTSIYDTTCGVTNGVGLYDSSYPSQTMTMKGIASWHKQGDWLLGRRDGGAEIHGYYGENQNVVVPQYIAGEKVVSIGERAFSTFSDAAVESITIQDGVHRIDSKAFENCPAKSIIIPSNVTSVGEYAFRHCGSLTSMAIPSRITSIPKGTFVGCESLIDITLPSGLKEICDSVFYGCTSLDGVSIPNSVTNIGISAFAGCTALSSMVIPSGVACISSEMFRNCSNLRIVTLQEGVREIGDNAFYGCISLEQIVIPDSIEHIGEGAFRGCAKLADADGFVVVRSKVYDYFGDPETLRIPDAVTEIEEGVFDRYMDLKALYLPFSDVELSKMLSFTYQNITNVVIRNGVETIGPSLFKGCIALENADIPSSVTNIADSSFSDCRNLSHVTIPVSVRDIGSSAFYGCSKLKSIRFLGDIVRVGVDAFYRCDSLSEVYIPNLSSWCSVSFGNSYANPIQKAGCFYLNDTLVNDLAIPDDVTGIGAYAFAGCRELNSVTIPVGVANIGWGAFSGCTGLTNITIPQIVCDSTLSKIFPDSYSKIRKVEFLDDVTSIGANLFSGCSSLSDILIPEGVTQMGASAFAGCTGLTSVTIPQVVCDSTLSKVFPDSYSNITKVVLHDNVTSIGANLFSGCASLSEITIPDGITNIGDGAFKGCKLLADKAGFVVYRGVLYDYLGTSADIALPSTITKVSPYSFKGCSGVTSVVIPETLADVGAYAFSGCDSLENVEMMEGVKDIGNHSFNNCRGLKNVSIPDSITNVCENAFDGCSSLSSAAISKYVIDRTVRNVFPSVYMNLKEISVLDGVTKIGDSAFYGCSSLEKVAIPDSVTKIEGYAFYGCRKLTYAAIPLGVESIGNYAFYDCSRMAEMPIPDSVSDIGYNAFGGCGNLTKVRVSQYVLDRTVNEVFSSAYGNLREIEISVSVTNIGNKAFYGCDSLEEITIPDSVTSIGDSAFMYCSSLTSVNLPDGLMSVGKNAFNGCASLSSITIPDSVTSIGDSVFYNCSSLKTVNLPENLTSIGKNLFDGCTALFTDGHFIFNSILYSYIGTAADVAIPDGIAKIADYAVYSRKTLKSVILPESVEYIGRYAFAEDTALTNITFLGNAPRVESTAFTNVANTCMVYVSRLSSGWDVDIPGEWNGLQIRYFNHFVTFNLGEYGVWVGGGELEQVVNTGDAAVAPIIEVAEGWEFERWSASFSKITQSLTVNAIYKRKPVIIDGVSWTYDIVNEAVTIGNGSECAVADTTTGILKIPSSIDGYPVKHIANRAFYGCSQVTGIELPTSIQSIGSSVFANCKKLTRIVLPYGIRIVPTGAFSGCTMLEEIVMPESITRILGSAFSSCTSLMDIKLPSNVTSIGSACFSGCRNLTRIEIPASVTEFAGSSPFGKCTSLTNVTFLGNAPTMEKINYLSGMHSECIVWVSRLSSGWDVDIPGEWKDVPIRYFNHYVTFELDDRGIRTGGGELSQLVNDGERAVAPTVEAVKGWKFDGWEPDIDIAVTSNRIFVAQYVRHIEPAVSVNGQEFETICEALDFAMHGETIRLIADVDLELPIEILDGKNVTIDLNGRKLLMTNGFDVCINVECGDLTIDDSVGGGCVVGDVVSSCGFIWLKNGKYEGYVYADDFMGGGMLVTGGMFKYPVDEWYLGEGLICEPTDDGDMFVIVERPVVYCTATFDIGEHGSYIGGGELVQVLEEGYIADIPEVEAVNGWIFTGWLPDATEPLFQDTTFVAQYEPRMYSVIFDLGEYGKHIGGGELTQSVQAGQFAEVPDISVLNGWEFAGWSPDVTKPISGDTVFVAQYVEAPPSREFEIDATECTKPLTVTVGETIRFNYDLGEIDEYNWGMCEGASYCAIVCDSTGNVLSELKYDTVPNVGYFNWTVSADCPKSCLVGVIPVEIWQDWGENPLDIFNGFCVTVQERDEVIKPIPTYTVTFVAGIGAHIGGGELVQTVEEGCSAIEPIMAHGPFEEGWYFVGWDCNDWQCVLEDMTVTAVYEFVSPRHCVVFDAGLYGTISDSSVQYVLDGEYASIPEVEAHEGWTFVGWSPNVNEPIYEDITFEAVYEQVKVEALPELGQNATTNEVKEVLKDAVDAALTNIVDAASYSSFKAWADNVRSPSGIEAGAQTVKESKYAWLSFALNTETLIAKDIESSDIEISSFKATDTSGGFDMDVSIKDIQIGAGTVDETTMKENLKKVFGIEGATSLDGNGFSSDNVGIEFGTPENGKVRLKAMPKDKSVKSFFMRVKVK